MPESWKRNWKTVFNSCSLHLRPCRKQSLTAAVYFIVLGNMQVSFQQKLPVVTTYVQFYEQWPLETERNWICTPNPTACAFLGGAAPWMMVGFKYGYL